LTVGRLPVALEDADGRRVDAFDRLDRGIEPTEVDRLPEGEVGESEEAWAAVCLPRRSERSRNRLQHVAAEMSGSHADLDLDLQRHVLRRPDLEVVARELIAGQMRDELPAKLLDQGGTAARQHDQVVARAGMGGDEHAVPAARPAKRRLCRGQLPELQRRLLVIGLGDGAELLGMEGAWRELPYLVDRFRLGAAARGGR